MKLSICQAICVQFVKQSVFCSDQGHFLLEHNHDQPRVITQCRFITSGPVASLYVMFSFISLPSNEVDCLLAEILVIQKRP